MVVGGDQNYIKPLHSFKFKESFKASRAYISTIESSERFYNIHVFIRSRALLRPFSSELETLSAPYEVKFTP